MKQRLAWKCSNSGMMNAASVLRGLSRIWSQFASNSVSLTLIKISRYGLILSAYESHRKLPKIGLKEKKSMVKALKEELGRNK